MLRLPTSAILVLALVGLAGVASQVCAQTRIMPLGDSITEAETGHASYRYWLWHELVDGGFDVDFVGTMNGVRGGPPLYEDFDQNHEGHWGWRADEVLAFIPTWAAAAQPEVVLMHLGHNDLWQGQGVDSTIDDLSGIVGELRSVVPNITVLLAQVIPGSGAAFDEIPDLNAAIAQLAGQLDTPWSRVIAVDHWTGFDPTTDTYDGTHPNEVGERKVSRRWVSALVTVLGRPAPIYRRSTGRRLVPGPP
jgi:hypothetical protein